MAYYEPGLDMNLNKVMLINDEKDNVEVLKEIIKSNDQEDAFYVLDVGNVIEKHKTWRSKIPRVEPYFAMRCNPDRMVVSTLAALNVGFDCASKHEIEQVLSIGVPRERVIYSSAVKLHSHIRYARKAGVDVLTVGSNELELTKIKSIFPEAKILISFGCDSTTEVRRIGAKQCCDPHNEVPKILIKAKELGIDVLGFSFNVGNQCAKPSAYTRGLRMALGMIGFAKSLGLEGIKLIDIGEVFLGENGSSINQFAVAINEVLDEIDPSIKIIGETGRYYVHSALTLASMVYGKRSVEEKSGTRYMYYINDGTYGSFGEIMRNINTRIPRPLNKPLNETTHLSSIWGPTCDSYDCVVRECEFPELQIGDWLVWPDMGTYTVTFAVNFNGFRRPAVFSIITRKHMEFIANQASC
ncbi:ornithine decarboxylase-like [Diprion similis]|uniref:ornithine decarboxylase-like n=1 Tax=Diprion similis TaxID=362088 RepID=UPI001EF8EEC1|nr:ornithine decarboxylase-like [Diprion similis]